MRVFTAHLRGVAAPVLVPEGFSWGAALFGPIWFALKGAWVAAAGFLLVWVVLLAVVHGPLRGPLEFWVAIVAGVFGQDLRRLALDWRGYVVTSVIVGRDADVAFTRLMDERPDLLESAT